MTGSGGPTKRDFPGSEKFFIMIFLKEKRLLSF